MSITQSSRPEEAIPFWNRNIPRRHWTEECPTFLVGLDTSDSAHLAVRDEDYRQLSWKDVQDLIRTNRLEVFKRLPSDLRRYRAFHAIVKQSHGSMLNFILQERLKWDDLTAKGTPFQEPGDIKILYNDWPYGLDPRIVHLVVWVKFSWEEDPKTGDLTSESRKEIDDWVSQTFRQSHNHDSVAWFKNWAAIKSVHAIEHFHVMLFDPDPEFIRQITDGRGPLAARMTNEELYGWSTE